jgi:hypothetical protein
MTGLIFDQGAWQRIDDMLDRLPITFFVTIGQSLQEVLDKVPKEPAIDLITSIVKLEVILGFLYTSEYGDPLPPKLSTSAAAGLSLRDALAELHKSIKSNAAEQVAEPLKAGEVKSITENINRFETVLRAELNLAFTYSVSQVGILAINSLIASADDVFEGYKDRVPDIALEDTKEAGRAIAFNLPTAAGFHIARATESVLLKYMAAFDVPKPPDPQRNWGNYTKLMRAVTAQISPKEKVLTTIDQIRILHRNPLLHPEQSLTMPEALSLWAICCSAIQAMIADMERKAATPNETIVAMLAPDEPTSN